MNLDRHVYTFGRWLRERFDYPVHKVAIHAGFTCPTIDGSKGHGGCSFCNNASFSPAARKPPDVTAQLLAGRAVMRKRRKVRGLFAYFQAYTNTYADSDTLARQYDQVLAHPDVVGISVGTRPDCLPESALDVLEALRDRGVEVWLELGLQSAFDDTLARVNRGHGLAEYRDAVRRARRRGLPVCTHLIVGLPGEPPEQALISQEIVLDLGVDGLKAHPLHVVKNTLLAKQWKRDEYTPMRHTDFVQVAAEMVRHAPSDIVFHRLTATAAPDLLLAPQWCAQKWHTLNAITAYLQIHGGQGSALPQPYPLTGRTHGTRLPRG